MKNKIISKEDTKTILTIYVALVCIFALLYSLLMMNVPSNIFLKALFINSGIIILFAFIIAALFPKKTIYELKQINRYSWLIIVFYLFGTLLMEYHTFQYSIHFAGILVTSPLIVVFTYWSQKNNHLLFSKDGILSNNDGFKADIFLMTTSFLLSGCISLMLNLNNSDFRSIWPFYLFFMGFYGLLFSLIYAVMGILFNKKHKKYTFFIASIIILIYSSISLFPKNGWFFNIMNCEPFYAFSILLLSFHLLVILFYIIKNKIFKTC